MKKLLSVIVFILICFNLMISMEKDFETGIIFKKDKAFFYEISPFSVRIYKDKGKPIFQRKIELKSREVFLSVGFSRNYNSFFVFKEKMIPKKKYTLLMIFNDKSLTISTQSSPFYSPVLFHYNLKDYIGFINENFEIKILDFMTKTIIKSFKFEVPVRSLSVSENGLKLHYYKFTKRGYKKGFIVIESIFSNEKTEIKQKSIANGGDSYFFEEKFNRKTDGFSYYGFLGFGDSITYGYINREGAPDKGYIPRLQLLIDNEWYGGTVYNEGIPGEVTEEGLERFESVVLKDRAKYLLFHEGTNDCLFVRRFPVSYILFNIEQMIKTALKYNMRPILTTIIPRNGKWGEGIYRERSIEVSEGIKDLANKYEIPLIDFFNIFLNYPESDGGYFSLMSDTVHPSEKGYQLMTEKWFEFLKNFPPEMPIILSYHYKIDPITKLVGMEISLSMNPDPDFDHFSIYYGEKTDKLNKLLKVGKGLKFEIFLQPGKKYFIGIKASDSLDNESKFSQIIEFTPYKLFF